MPLLLLPSCLWRLPFALHFAMGQVHDGGGMPTYWISIPYVLALSVIVLMTKSLGDQVRVPEGGR